MTSASNWPAVFEQRHENGLFYRSYEPSKARGTIVYIHGLGESGLAFEPLMRSPFLASWRHLAPDLPGYGKSPWPQEPMSLPQLSRRIAAWLEARSLQQVVLAGHSMGGVIGQMICENHGHFVKALINVEGNISIDDCMFSSKAAAYTKEELIESGMSRIVDQVYRDGLSQEILRSYYVSLRICWPAMFHQNSVELVEISRSGKLAPRMAALDLPSIYLLGRPHGTGAVSRQMLDLAGVEWRAIDKAGHWVFLDQPAAFGHEVNDFLSTLA